MNRILKKTLCAATASLMALSLGAVQIFVPGQETASAADTASEWGTLSISGGGFVSGIVCGQKVMYARTDVGGAYRYDNGKWTQLFSFVSEEDKGLLSIDAIAIDPTNDDNVYMFAGCNYFSNAKSAVLRSTDGGKSFEQIDVSDLIRTHGNGYGRQNGERLAVDPKNPAVLYCGGRTGGLIKSTDYGKTWKMVDSLKVMDTQLKWPEWTDFIADTTENSNGICCVAIDDNSNVYAAVSVTGKTNMYVSSDEGKTWDVLSDELPTDLYPQRINKDADGNLLISYVPNITFGSSGGGAYRYDINKKTITDISLPGKKPVGAVYCAGDNSDELIATTCGMWWTQLWDEGVDCYGDLTYKSADGGKNWTLMEYGLPGDGAWGTKSAQYLDTNDTDWIYGKAIHWSGCIVANPVDPKQVFVTSGNGIFACDDIWDELPQFYFCASGIEEVVALDLVSVPGGNVYSAIGDYDGFVHSDVDTAVQYTPNMGSTGAIAYCPTDTNVMVRYSEHEAGGYYSTDAGKTWTLMGSNPISGGKAAITKLSDGTYRFFRGANYSDDYGKTWNKCEGLNPSSVPYLQVDSEKPNYIYAGGNDNNGYDPTCKPNNYLYVSSDYGKTFTAKKICAYDRAEDYGRICMVNGTSGKVLAPTGYYGLYGTDDYGENFTKYENVDTCFAVGSGAAKDASSPKTIYIWGQCNGSGVTGIYASTDDGKTWTRVNDDEHQYGGPGNGRFIVGDENTYGTFYMSTVGLGIVYHQNTSGSSTNPPVTTQPDVTTTPVTTTTAAPATTPAVSETQPTTDYEYGDINRDKVVEMTDLTLLSQYLLGDIKLDPQQILLADVNGDGGTDIADLSHFKQYILKEPVKLGPQK